MVNAGFHAGKFFRCKVKVIEAGKGFAGFEPNVDIAVSDRIGNDLVALAFGKLDFSVKAKPLTLLLLATNFRKEYSLFSRLAFNFFKQYVNLPA
jgi:hypothetical protein